MGTSIAKQLMNRGNAQERQLGRMLARGRTRGLPAELKLALDLSEKILKDFGGAPAGAMTGADVNTPVAGGNAPPRRRKASRLDPNA